jgi:C1A family cysteine protease
MEGDVKKDAGAQIRTVVKTLNETGVCLEIDEPYIVSNFAKTPSQAAMDNAAKYKSGAYHRVVGGVEDMKSVLRSGYIMVVGFSVYESFESSYTAQTGQMLVPGPKEKCLGGHCVLCIGYDDNREAFKFRNSWSTAWGDEGNFWMGYRIADMPNTISDAWVSHLGPAWKPKPEETPQSNT